MFLCRNETIFESDGHHQCSHGDAKQEYLIFFADGAKSVAPLHSHEQAFWASCPVMNRRSGPRARAGWRF
jgi:hypothetical protein